MHVAVVIVGFRNAADVARCLAALGESDYRDFEVVIVENGGEDAFAALRAAMPDRLPGGQAVALLCAPGNLGFAGGINMGMRARPDADAWWLLNPDTQPDATALSALVARLQAGDCDAVGGTLYGADGQVQSLGGRWRPSLARAESIGRGDPVEANIDPRAVEKATNYISGASLLVGRRFVDTVGLMRDDYFLYAEEVEWCLRGGKLGMRFGFAPGARVRHGQGGTTGSADAIHTRPRLPIYLDERNKLNVVRDTTPARLVTAIPAAFALTVMRFARRGAWTPWRHALAGWWAGVRGERGMPPWMR